MPLRVVVPGSKSMTQRALIVAALGRAPTRLRGALLCDDSRLLTGLLRACGVSVRWDRGVVDVVPPPNGLRAPKVPVHCGNAGTTLRFGAALALCLDGALTLDGVARMRERPIGDLVLALRQLGATVSFGLHDGYPPVTIEACASPGSAAIVDTSRSSQFASGLLLVAPALPGGLRLELTGSLKSRPYVDMTVQMVRRAGARIAVSEPPERRVLSVPPQGGYLGGGELEVEPDWSSAALVLAAGFVSGVAVEVEQLPDPRCSLQGDAAFADFLEGLRAPGPRQFVLSDTPDLLPPLAVAALRAEGRTELVGVEHARLKESDRVAVLATELGRLGAQIEERVDGLVIEGGRPLRATVLDPHDDHRLAMAFGALSLAVPGLEVRDRACVSKSFPSFWSVLDALSEAAGGASQDGSERAGMPVLVGLRGSGKTTVAPRIADALGCRWVDVDAELEWRAQRTIATWISEDGEASFRAAERALLLELLDDPYVLLATGGGAVLHDAVRARLCRRPTVWLHGELALLARRIAGSERPSLSGASLEEELAAQSSDRHALYAGVACARIDVDGLSVDDVAARVVEACRLPLPARGGLLSG